jgi:hypothetical protein
VEKKMPKTALPVKETADMLDQSGKSLGDQMVSAPTQHERMPNPEELLLNCEDAPKITDRLNIFPFDWRVETPRLMEIYESSRDPGWSPSKLPWHTLDVESMTLDQRYAIAYWW